MKIHKLAVGALIVSLSLGAVPARAQDATRIVSQTEIDRAVTERVQADATDRQAVQTLLGRDDIQAMASGMGLDIRRAQSSVSSLQGANLRNVAARATAANEMLSGGATTVRISLVAVLLIVIIVILLSN